MSSEMAGKQYGILELVQASGVPRRTIRYYVQRGLLAPPEGAGRGHFYRPSHLERLVRIRELQDKGFGLDEIKTVLEDPGDTLAEPSPAPEVELITRIGVTEGIDLVVSHGARPPSPTQVRAIAIAAAKILGGR